MHPHNCWQSYKSSRQKCQGSLGEEMPNAQTCPLSEEGCKSKQTNGIARELLFLVLRQLAPLLPSHLYSQVIECVERRALLPLRYQWDSSNVTETYSFLNEQYKSMDTYYLFDYLNALLHSYGQTSLLSHVKALNLSFQGNFKHDISKVNTSILMMNQSLGIVISEECMTRPHIISNFKQVLTIKATRSVAYCTEFSKNSTAVITGSDDGIVKIWNAKNGWLNRILRGHMGIILDISISNDNSTLVTTSNDGLLRLWDLATGTPLQVLNNSQHTYPIINFHPVFWVEKSLFMIVEHPCTVKLHIWYPREQRISEYPIAVYKCGMYLGRDEVRGCNWLNGGTSFVVVGTDGLMRIYRTPTWEQLNSGYYKQPDSAPELTVFNDHEGYINVFVNNAAGDQIATGSLDGSVWLYKFDPLICNWKPLQLDCHADALNEGIHTGRSGRVKIKSLCFDESAEYLMTSSTDNILRIWDTVTGRLVHRLYFHTDIVYLLISHPISRNVILSAGEDGRIGLWNMEKGLLLKDFAFPDTKFASADFSSDGSTLAITDELGRLHFLSMCNDFTSYSRTATTQFFPSESRDLIRDQNHVVIDAQTQIQPHLMQPEKICDDSLSPHLIQPTSAELYINWKPSDFEIEQWKGLIESSAEYEELMHRMISANIEPAEARKKYRRRVIYESDNEVDANGMFSQQPQSIWIDDPNDEAYTESDISSNSDDNISQALDEEDLQLIHRTRRRTRLSGISSPQATGQNGISRRRSTRHRRIESDSSSENDISEIYIERRSPQSRPQKEYADSDFLPSPWISSFERCELPYTPQVGDTVVYFPSGHHQFNALESRKHSAISNIVSSVQDAYVKEVRYIVGPPSFAELMLELYSPTGRSTRRHITVRYYKRDDISDFIILKSLYDYAVRQNWKNNERVLIRTTQGYQEGKIATILDASFNNIIVYLKDNPEELFKKCIWDLRPILLNSIRRRSDFVYDLTMDPLVIRTCLEEVEKAMALEIAFDFVNPVDYAMYPLYLRIVPYPMYLDLLSARLQNGYYRRLEAFFWDLERIEVNAVLYNDEQSELVRNARKIVASIQSAINQRLDQLGKKPQKERATVVKETSDVDISRSNSEIEKDAFSGDEYSIMAVSETDGEYRGDDESEEDRKGKRPQRQKKMKLYKSARHAASSSKSQDYKEIKRIRFRHSSSEDSMYAETTTSSSSVKRGTQYENTEEKREPSRSNSNSQSQYPEASTSTGRPRRTVRISYAELEHFEEESEPGIHHSQISPDRITSRRSTRAQSSTPRSTDVYPPDPPRRNGPAPPRRSERQSPSLYHSSDLYSHIPYSLRRRNRIYE